VIAGVALVLFQNLKAPKLPSMPGEFQRKNRMARQRL